MEPGFYNLTFEEYLALDAVNAGRLSDFRRSPAACRLRLDEPIEPTRAMVLGTAVHAALLESEHFAERFAFYEFDGRTKEGKKERAEIAESGKVAMAFEDYKAALAMGHSLYTHPRIRALLDAATWKECSVVWTDPQSGRLCKGRPDLVGPGWIADLKTTSELDRFSPWQVTDLGYYRQAAWYAWGAERLGRVVEHFFFAVVQNDPPFESALYRVADDSLAAGRREMSRLLAMYLESEKLEAWPRHVTELMTAEASAARLREIEEL